jgi:hypothetical protein
LFYSDRRIRFFGLNTHKTGGCISLPILAIWHESCSFNKRQPVIPQEGH